MYKSITLDFQGLLYFIYFSEEVGDVTYVELFNDENDKPRGCGILEFATEEMAKRAVEKMHRHEFRGRKLVVKEVCHFYYIFEPNNILRGRYYYSLHTLKYLQGITVPTFYLRTSIQNVTNMDVL